MKIWIWRRPRKTGAEIIEGLKISESCLRHFYNQHHSWHLTGKKAFCRASVSKTLQLINCDLNSKYLKWKNLLNLYLPAVSKLDSKSKKAQIYHPCQTDKLITCQYFSFGKMNLLTQTDCLSKISFRARHQDAAHSLNIAAGCCWGAPSGLELC